VSGSARLPPRTAGRARWDGIRSVALRAGLLSAVSLGRPKTEYLGAGVTKVRWPIVGCQSVAGSRDRTWSCSTNCGQNPSRNCWVCRATASSVGSNCDRAMTDRETHASTLKRQGLYPCEEEIARRLSQSQKRWRQIAPEFERQGLPKIDPIMKGRFWPAVEAFFLNRHGLGNIAASQPDGEERWDVA